MTQTNALAAQHRLFAAGQRLGWTFRDRHQFYQQFPTTRPVEQPLPAALVTAHDNARRACRRQMVGAVILGAVGFVVLCTFGGCLWFVREGAGQLMLAVALLVPVPVVLRIVAARRTWAAARVSYQQAAQQHHRTYLAQMHDWERGYAEHHARERRRIDELDEWGAVRPSGDIRRLDIFGGTLYSREAFLTVYGGSLLSSGPLVVADLSGELVSWELMTLARRCGRSVSEKLLPAQLAETDLLSGLDSPQVVNLIIESMSGEQVQSSMHQQMIHHHILDAVVSELGGQFSMARLAAAIRTLAGEPDNSGLLTDDEHARISGSLFSDAFRAEHRTAIHHLWSYIRILGPLGTARVREKRSDLSCLVLESQGLNVQTRFLAPLIVQGVTHQLLTAPRPPASVVIVGADDLPRRQLEHLSNVCERLSVHLTFMFRNLRDTAKQLVGGGAVGFMRMGNPDEAQFAAQHIGQDYKFVVSQLTATIGGSHTHGTTKSVSETNTASSTETEGTSQTTGVTRTSGRHSDTTRDTTSGTSQETEFPGLSVGNPVRHQSRSSASTTGKMFSLARSWSTTLTRSVAMTLGYAVTQGTSVTEAHSSDWHNATSSQRVKEYRVEPETLQHLPDYALLYVESKLGNRTVIPVECDPEIVTLPRVSTDPLPPAPPASPRQSQLPDGAYYHPTGAPVPGHISPGQQAPWAQPPVSPTPDPPTYPR